MRKIQQIIFAVILKFGSFLLNLILSLLGEIYCGILVRKPTEINKFIL